MSQSKGRVYPISVRTEIGVGIVDRREAAVRIDSEVFGTLHVREWNVNDFVRETELS